MIVALNKVDSKIQDHVGKEVPAFQDNDGGANPLERGNSPLTCEGGID